MLSIISPGACAHCVVAAYTRAAEFLSILGSGSNHGGEQQNLERFSTSVKKCPRVSSDDGSDCRRGLGFGLIECALQFSLCCCRFSVRLWRGRGLPSPLSSRSLRRVIFFTTGFDVSTLISMSYGAD